MESTLVDCNSLGVVFLGLLGLLQAGQASVVKKKDEEEPWTDPFTYPNGTRKVIFSYLILNFMKLFESMIAIWHNRKLSEAIKKYPKLLKVIWRYQKLSDSIKKLPDAIKSYMTLLKTFWNFW